MTKKRRTIQVRGEGIATASPDVAVLWLGPVVRHEAPAAAFTRAMELTDALVAALHAAGVAPTDVQTAAVTLHPEHEHNPTTGRSRLAGWAASHLLTVRVRDLTRVAAILAEAVGLLGADAQVQSISFGIEDSDALISRARAAAFDRARSAAEELAQQAGGRLAGVLGVEEVDTSRPSPVAAEAAGRRRLALMAAPAGDVAPGKISIHVLLSVTFALGRA